MPDFRKSDIRLTKITKGGDQKIMDYKKAGVDIEAGYKSVELMKKHIAKTMRPEVLGGIGGFSGAFSMNAFKRYGRTNTGIRYRRLRNQS